MLLPISFLNYLERAVADLEGVFRIEARDACFRGRSGFGDSSGLAAPERREWTAQKDRHLPPSTELGWNAFYPIPAATPQI